MDPDRGGVFVFLIFIRKRTLLRINKAKKGDFTEQGVFTSKGSSRITFSEFFFSELIFFVVYFTAVFICFPLPGISLRPLLFVGVYMIYIDLRLR